MERDGRRRRPGDPPRLDRAGLLLRLSGVLLRLRDRDRVRRRLPGLLLRLLLGVYDPRRFTGEGDLERECSRGTDRDLSPRLPRDLDLDLDLDLDMDLSGDREAAGGDFWRDGEGDLLLEVPRGFACGDEPSCTSSLLALSSVGSTSTLTVTSASGCTVGCVSPFLQ